MTNLALILFSKRMENLSSLHRKDVRVIQYRGIDRTVTLREQVGTKGYASGFEGLIGYINGLLPSNELIGEALRRTVPGYPELVVRELVANALIHQDFQVSGTGQMVSKSSKIASRSLNPGVQLVDAQRNVDSHPRSRNGS